MFRQATRAKALDAARGILPAASLSNVGIYGTGQAFEALLLRLRAHPLPEARDYGELMLHELRKVIPSFLRRVDLPDRGGRWSDVPGDDPTAHRRTGRLRCSPRTPRRRLPSVTLVDFDPDAEDKLLAAICYPHSHLPEQQLARRVSPGWAPTSASPSSGRTSASGRTGGTSRDGRSSASTTGSTCCPTTARSATSSVIAC